MNEEYQEPMPMNYGNYTNPYPQQPMLDSGVYEKIIDNSELIEDLMHTLRGEIVDLVTNKINKYGKPIVSETTINWMVGRLMPYTSKIFSLSILDERTVRQIIYEFEVELSLDLMFPEKFGIERKNRDYIKWLMVHCFQASIFKAFKGETIRRILEQHHIQETTINEKRKENVLDKLKGALRI